MMKIEQYSTDANLDGPSAEELKQAISSQAVTEIKEPEEKVEEKPKTEEVKPEEKKPEEKPEFLVDKFKTIEDQAKAYAESEKRMKQAVEKESQYRKALQDMMAYFEYNPDGTLKPKQAEPQQEEVDFYSDPENAVSKIIQKQLEPYKKKLETTEQELIKQKFIQTRDELRAKYAPGKKGVPEGLDFKTLENEIRDVLDTNPSWYYDVKGLEYAYKLVLADKLPEIQDRIEHGVTQNITNKKDNMNKTLLEGTSKTVKQDKVDFGKLSSTEMEKYLKGMI